MPFDIALLLGHGVQIHVLNNVLISRYGTFDNGVVVNSLIFTGKF